MRHYTGQFVVFHRPLFEILVFFGMPQFDRLMHHNFVMRDRRNVLPAQTFGPQVSALHPVARVKGAMLVKHARAFVVKSVPMIVAAPEMVMVHKNIGVKTQAEAHSIHDQSPMPE
jgi:hypothetical protein